VSHWKPKTSLSRIGVIIIPSAKHSPLTVTYFQWKDFNFLLTLKQWSSW